MNSQVQNIAVDIHTPNERSLAALAHASALLNVFAGLGGIIASLVIWLTQKDKSPWVGFQALQAAIFQGIVLIFTVVLVGLVWLAGFALSFATIGIGTLVAVPVMILVFFLGFGLIAAGMVYACYAAYQIYQGREFQYRWIGEWIQRRSIGN